MELTTGLRASGRRDVEMKRIRTMVVAIVAFAAGAGVAVTVSATRAPVGSSVSTSAPVSADPVSSLLSVGALSSTSPGCDAALQRKAFVALVAVESAETGMSMKDIRTQLMSGKTLDQIAGSKDAKVRTTALDDVQQLLDLAVANGKVKVADESADLAKAKDWVNKAMTLDVRSVPKPSAKPSGCGRGHDNGKPSPRPSHTP